VKAYVTQKRRLFCEGEVFFLLTRPLMGAYEKVSQEKHFSISKKYLFSYLRSPIVAYPWTTFEAIFLYLTDVALSTNL
jgi:hypothetical protein